MSKRTSSRLRASVYMAMVIAALSGCGKSAPPQGALPQVAASPVAKAGDGFLESMFRNLGKRAESNL